MSTTTRTRRGTTSTPAQSLSVTGIDFASIVKEMDLQVYGVGSPLYKIVHTYGTVVPMNTVDGAFEKFADAKAQMKEGNAGFMYSPTYDAFSMGFMHGGGIVYASVQHDKDGDVLELPEYKLCKVIVTRDFTIEGQDEPILREGDTFLKVLDPNYAGA